MTFPGRTTEQRKRAAAGLKSRMASNEKDSKSISSPFHQEVNASQYSENEISMKPPPNVTGARSLLSKAFMRMTNIFSHVRLMENVNLPGDWPAKPLSFGAVPSRVTDRVS
jgi:hypothetical protein